MLFAVADAFCRAVSLLAAAVPDVAWETPIPAFGVADMGDLMGAIHGVRHTGFIGDVYRRYPFPERPEDFRQKTRGYETRDEFRALIAPWAREEEIRLAARSDAREVFVGEVRFARGVFHDLVRYVWRGGWPRWENDEPPDYVNAMRAAITEGKHWATQGIDLPNGAGSGTNC